MWWIGSDIGDMRNIWKENNLWRSRLVLQYLKSFTTKSTTSIKTKTFSFPKIKGVLTLTYLTSLDFFSVFKFSLWNLLSKATYRQRWLTLFLNICCELRRYFLSVSLGLTKNLHYWTLEDRIVSQRVIVWPRCRPNIETWELSICWGSVKIYFCLRVLTLSLLCLSFTQMDGYFCWNPLTNSWKPVTKF